VTPDATVADTPGECALLAIELVPDGTGPEFPGLMAARAYLADLDLKEVDYADELAARRVDPIVDSDGAPTGRTASDVDTDSQLEFFAYRSATSAMVFEEVERQGIDPDFAIQSIANGCDDR
jgi:hypothetical protein